MRAGRCTIGDVAAIVFAMLALALGFHAICRIAGQ